MVYKIYLEGFFVLAVIELLTTKIVAFSVTAMRRRSVTICETYPKTSVTWASRSIGRTRDEMLSTTTSRQSRKSSCRKFSIKTNTEFLIITNCIFSILIVTNISKKNVLLNVIPLNIIIGQTRPGVSNSYLSEGHIPEKKCSACHSF